jgi:predicted aspartyl protease
MIKHALLGLTTMLAISVVRARSGAGETPPKSFVIPLVEIAGHPSIELKFNGKGPYRLILDTGSGADLIVDQELADALGLKSTGTRRIGDPNTPEALEANVVKIGRVELSGLTLRNVDAISWKRQYMGVEDFPRGVVGLGLFGPRLLTLDYGRGALIVETGDLPQPDGKTVLTASFEDGIPSLPIDVAGVAYRAHLDSGSTGFVGLPQDAAAGLPLEAPPAIVGRARTASGDYTVSEARLQGALHLGAITLENPRLRFVNLPQANLGFDFLRALVVTVDRKNGRVRLVANGKPLEPTERPRLGIMTQGPKDGRLPVDHVAPGSPAAAAGVREGDQIVSLNGRAVAEMNRSDVSQAMMARPLAIALLRDGAPVELTVGANPAPPR